LDERITLGVEREERFGDVKALVGCWESDWLRSWGEAGTCTLTVRTGPGDFLLSEACGVIGELVIDARASETVVVLEFDVDVEIGFGRDCEGEEDV
jgi:hypothetical protein